MKKRIFVTGISTEVGKTIASAILVEALQADYWKPIQAGDLDNSDSHKVARLISNKKTIIHPNAYALKTPMSPHAAAEIDGLEIALNTIGRPQTNNHLVVEGAGGLLVPLNKKDTILDLVEPTDTVVVVSRHYLGSINHTLLTLDKLASLDHKAVLIFSGDEHPTTEKIILEKTGVRTLGRIGEEPFFNTEIIKGYAHKFSASLQEI